MDKHPIPQWLRDAFSTIENCAPSQNAMQVFTQMRTVVQSYFQSCPSPAESDKEAVRNAELEEAARYAELEEAARDAELRDVAEAAEYADGDPMTAVVLHISSKARALKSQPAQPRDDVSVDAFLSEVRAELIRARAKFPGDRIMTIALAEEFGELCKAVLEESADNVRKEAVQTAVMCARVVLDGDGSVNSWRAERGLDPLVTQSPEQPAMPSDTEKDAARYRWLRDHCQNKMLLNGFAEDMDAEIDYDMKNREGS